MSTATVQAPSVELDRREGQDVTPPLGGEEVTLEDAVLGVWEGLAVAGRARCLVCGGETTAVGGCASCGSELR